MVWLQDVKSALSSASSQIGANSPDYAALRGNVDASLIKLAGERIAAGDLDTAERVGQAGQQIDPSEAGYAKVLAAVTDARNTAQKKTLQQQAQSRARTALAARFAGAHARLATVRDDGDDHVAG